MYTSSKGTKQFKRGLLPERFLDHKQLDEFIQKSMDLYTVVPASDEIYKATEYYAKYTIMNKSNMPDLVYYTEPFNKNTCFYDYYGRGYNEYPRTKFKLPEEAENYFNSAKKEKEELHEVEVKEIEEENKEEGEIIKEENKENKEEIKEEVKEEINDKIKENSITEEIKESPKEEIIKEEIKESPKEEIKESPKEEIVKEEIKESPIDIIKESPIEDIHKPLNDELDNKEEIKISKESFPSNEEKMFTNSNIFLRRIQQNEENSMEDNSDIKIKKEENKTVKPKEKKGKKKVRHPNTNQHNTFSVVQSTESETISYISENKKEESKEDNQNVIISNENMNINYIPKETTEEEKESIPKINENLPSKSENLEIKAEYEQNENQNEILKEEPKENQMEQKETNTFQNPPMIPNMFIPMMPAPNPMMPFPPFGFPPMMNPMAALAASSMAQKIPLTYQEFLIADEMGDADESFYCNFNEDYSKYSNATFLEKPVLIVKKNLFNAHWFLMRDTKILGNYNSEQLMEYLAEGVKRGSKFEGLTITDYQTDLVFQPMSLYDILRIHLPKLKKMLILTKGANYYLQNTMTNTNEIRQNNMQMGNSNGNYNRYNNGNNGRMFNRKQGRSNYR
ncbi:MAG: hypothetical protein MJ252_02740, partial [archaeon]|nr:hypothetical protein [archaeon]